VNRQTYPRPRTRRAFATVYAVVLLGIVAVALTMSGALLARELSRTGHAIEVAQLRVLLRHAADLTPTLAKSPEPNPLSIQLPPDLTADGYRLTVSFSSPPNSPPASALLTATSPRGKLQQRLTLSPTGQIRSAELQPQIP